MARRRRDAPRSRARTRSPPRPGSAILRAGGNVVDAAAAVSFALGVVEPDASGIAGYGQMLIHLDGMEKPRLIEFMSRVPEDAGVNAANPPTGAWRRAVDGERPGHRRRDAPRVAATRQRQGGVGRPPRAGDRRGAGWLRGERRTRDDAHRRARRIHAVAGQRARSSTRNGRAARAGDTMRNPDLAWVLGQIAANGADGFYKGEVAQRIVDDLRARGNAMKLSDLARYYAADREPVSTTYRGYTIYSSAPPVDGGATLAARLNLLENFPNPKRYVEDAATAHAMIAAWQLVPTTQRRIADPGFWPVNIEPFMNKDTARIRWSCFDREQGARDVVGSCRGDGLRSCSTGRGRARRTSRYLPHLRRASRTATTRPTSDPAVPRARRRSRSVTPMANLVAVTQTLGTWGGSFYVTPGLGFLYNDKLNSYAGGNADRRLRLAPLVRAPWQHARADDRVQGNRAAKEAGDRSGCCRQRVDHFGGLSDTRRHDRRRASTRRPRSSSRASSPRVVAAAAERHSRRV